MADGREWEWILQYKGKRCGDRWITWKYGTNMWNSKRIVRNMRRRIGQIWLTCRNIKQIRPIYNMYTLLCVIYEKIQFGTVAQQIKKKQNRHYLSSFVFIRCWWYRYMFRSFSWVIFRRTRIHFRLWIASLINMNSYCVCMIIRVQTEQVQHRNNIHISNITVYVWTTRLGYPEQRVQPSHI
jgi:hypothetical protein